jgi:ribosomal protein S27E
MQEWWYEIHCPDCGVLKRDSPAKKCPECGNPQAICLEPEVNTKTTRYSVGDDPSQECL